MYTPAKKTRPPLPQDDAETLACPICSNAVKRIPRHFSDRLRSLFAPVRRYRCVISTCGWEGTRRSHQPDAQRSNQIL